MAKRLLLNVLVKVLGEFVELDEDNLSLAVWSGQVTLRHLKLKSNELLKKFHFQIHHGSIETLEIVIPWTSLLNSPLKLKFDGVLLDLGPEDPTKHDLSKVFESMYQDKLKELLQFDSTILQTIETEIAAASASSSSSSSYVQQWTSRIIDNLEINLTNIHIRYEDSFTIPGQCFAFGATIESFGIITCDSNWQVSINASSSNVSSSSSPSSIYKLAALRSFSFYWETQAVSLSKLKYDAWKEEMLSRIYSRGSIEYKGKLNYIVQPTERNLFLKLYHNKSYNKEHKKDKNRPTDLESAVSFSINQFKFDVHAESNNVNIHLDKLQYLQIFLLTNKLKNIKKVTLPYLLRPPTNPGETLTSSKDWWKYLIRLNKIKIRYIYLYKLKKRKETKKAESASVDIDDSIQLSINPSMDHDYKFLQGISGGKADALIKRVADKQEKELAEFDKILPNEVIKRFRYFALLEFHREQKKSVSSPVNLSSATVHPSKVQASSNSPPKSGWGGGIWNWVSSVSTSGTNPSNDKENGSSLASSLQRDDISIDEVINLIGSSDLALKDDNNFFSCVRIIIQCSSTLVLSSEWKPISTISGGFSFSFIKFYDDMLLKCDVTNFKIDDNTSLFPAHPQIFSVSTNNVVKTTNTTPSTLSLVATRVKNKIKVKASSLPIEVFINKHCIQYLISEFSIPAIKTKKDKDKDKKVSSSTTTSTLSTQGIQNFVEKHKDEVDFELSLDFHCPIIIIPMTTHSNSPSLSPSNSSSVLTLEKPSSPSQDSTNEGYCILNCGTLKVDGWYMGSMGMSFQVHVSNINVGLPNHLTDLNSLEDLSLYLIRPFDLSLDFQNVDKAVGDIVLNASISPALKGDIDAIKLSRLLNIIKNIGGLTTPLSPPWVKSEKDIFHQQIISALTLYSKKNEENEISQPSNTIIKSILSTPVKIQNRLEESFSSSLSSPDHLAESPDDSDLIFTDCRTDFASNGSTFSSPTATPTKNSTDSPVPVDPLRVNMKVKFNLPLVELDLKYTLTSSVSSPSSTSTNPSTAPATPSKVQTNSTYNIVLSIVGLSLDASFRSYDSIILFNMNDLKIEDSCRAPSQRYLAYTPKYEVNNLNESNSSSTSSNLVSISYVSIKNFDSPLFKDHATEITVDFADLNLDLDVNTLLHLKPFLIALLRSDTEETSAITLSSDSSNDLSDPSLVLLGNSSPSGLLINASMHRLSLTLLRTTPEEFKNTGGIELDRAFALNVIDFDLQINNKELMKSVVKLRIFEILDLRKSSENFVFRHLFKPTALVKNDDSKMFQFANASSMQTAEDTTYSKFDQKSECKEENYLLVLNYEQESKTHSLISTKFAEVTSYVAIDALLDFSSIATANFFTITGLLSTSASSPAPTPSSISNSQKSSPLSISSTKVDSSTTNFLVKMSDFHMIFLEDPEVSDSRAIVAEASMDIHYTRDSKNTTIFYVVEENSDSSGFNYSTQLIESLHLSVPELRVSVLNSLASWKPLPIIEPFGIELHFKRSHVNSVVQDISLQVSLDTIISRVTFNDLLLATSIFNRKSLAERDELDDMLLDEIIIPKIEQIVAHQPNNLISFTMSSLDLTIVNDFYFKSGTPIVRFFVDESSFHSQQRSVKSDGNSETVNQSLLVGEGITQIKMEYFNSRLLTWEPLLDSWRMELAISSHELLKSFEIKGGHTLQLTISGSMLETLLKSYSLFFKNFSSIDSDHENSSSVLKDQVVTVFNQLGEGIDVDILDTSSKTSILYLKPGECLPISSINDPSVSINPPNFSLSNVDSMSYISTRVLRVPNAVDVVVKSPLLGKREPLRCLPLRIQKPRTCVLQAEGAKSSYIDINDESHSDSEGETSTDSTPMEPIEEEIYENSRYDPITGKWRKPFFPNDPFEWSDSTTMQKKDIGVINSSFMHTNSKESVQAPQTQDDKSIDSDLEKKGVIDGVVKKETIKNILGLTENKEWEWCGDWEVDLDGVIDKEIDSQGWEYATTFSAFSMTSLRRAYQPLDMVRRRRWSRMRIPKTNSISQFLSIRSLPIFWDLKQRNIPSSPANGQREIVLRSGFQIVNELGCDLKVSLFHSVWDKEFEIPLILSNSTYNVPLIQSLASHIRFMPSSTNSSSTYKWSSHFNCVSRSYDYKISKDAVCQGAPVPNSPSSIPPAPVCFRVWVIREGKSVTVRLVPYISISNKLLTHLDLLVTNNFNNTITTTSTAPETSVSSSSSTQPNLPSVPIFPQTLGSTTSINRVNLVSSTNSTQTPRPYITTILSPQSSKQFHELHHHIPSGTKADLLCSSFLSSPLLSIKTGYYDWSEQVSLSLSSLPLVLSKTSNSLYNKNNENNKREHEIVLDLKKIHQRDDILPVVLVLRLNSYNTLEIDIFFQVIFLDRSKLNLLVGSYIQGKGRYTRSMDSTSTPAVSDTTILSEVHEKKTTTPFPNKNFITNLSVSSGFPYELTKLESGSHCYSDSHFRYTHLPLYLKGHYSLKFSLKDRKSKADKFVSFTPTVDCALIMLIDFSSNSVGSATSTSSMTYSPVSLVPCTLASAPHTNTKSWLSSSGFVNTGDMAVARKFSKSSFLEINFSVFAKFCKKDQEVTLKGGWDSKSPYMYSLIFLPWISPTVSNPTPAPTPAPTQKFDSLNKSSQLDILVRHNINLSYGKPIYPIDPSHLPYITALNLSHKYDNNSITLHSLYQVLEFNQSLQEADSQFGSSLSDNLVHTLADFSFTQGAHNMTAFYTNSNMVSVKTLKDSNWSDTINIDTSKNSSNKDSFIISSSRSQIQYHVSYRMENLPGLYSRTQFITFMPKFVLVNYFEDSLFIAQKGSHKHIELMPFVSEPWHQIDNQFGFDVKIKTRNSIWSLGYVNINEIGTSIIYLPNDNSLNSTSPLSTKKGIVIHVEVKLAEPHDHCSIIVSLWQELVEAQNTTLSICNNTDLHLTFRQAQIDFIHELSDFQASLYELTVPPNKHYPFGWSDPDCSSLVNVSVGTNIKDPKNTNDNYNRTVEVNMLQDGCSLSLPYMKTITHSDTSENSSLVMDEIILTLSISEIGHVLVASYGSSSNETTSQEAITNNSFSVLSLSLILPSVGLSLVFDRPKRREFMSLYLDNLSTTIKKHNHIVNGKVSPANMNFNHRINENLTNNYNNSLLLYNDYTTLEFSIMDLQLDNYSETAIYPVFLRSTKDGNTPTESTSPDNQSNKPFIEFSLILEQPVYSKKPFIKYIGLRILPLIIEVDSATLQIFYMDLLDNLKILSSAQALARSIPPLWLYEFHYNLLHPDQKLINLHSNKLFAQKNRVFIKNMIIHPMKFTVTLYQSTLHREDNLSSNNVTLQSTFLNIITSLVGVEKLQLILTSFEIEDALESFSTIFTLISHKTFHDLRSQLTQIAGSLALIGSPIGFARKVGGGLKAFFYEPYLGAVHGSKDFVKGLKKGTGSLLRGVVVGAMDSTAAFIGTASKSMRYLSGDIDYVRARALKQQQLIANRGGIYDGFINGGESIVAGFTSGVTGLVSKPIEEATKGGLQGFIKGIGLGLLGAAVKPLVGFTEGLTSIAYGISAQVDQDSQLVHHVRPPRALERLEDNAMMISRLDLGAAYWQDLVLKRAKQNNYQDNFLSFISLEKNGEAIILTDVYIFWWKSDKVLWGRMWGNVSHCLYMGHSIGLMLYSSEDSQRPNNRNHQSSHHNISPNLVIFQCGSKQVVQKLYNAFYQQSYRMGNPNKILSPDLIDWDNSQKTVQIYHQIITKNFVLNETTSSQVKKMHKLLDIGNLSDYSFNNNLKDSSLIYSTYTTMYNFSHSQYFSLLPLKSSTPLPPTHFASEEEFFAYTRLLFNIGTKNWFHLDILCWAILNEWKLLTRGRNSLVNRENLKSFNYPEEELKKKCCLTLLINSSSSAIQVSRIQMMLGKDIQIYGNAFTGYDTASRTIYPNGGYIVLFITSYPPSSLEDGHIRVKVNSTAFSAVLASIQRDSFCESKPGFHISFLEKINTDSWSKYVLNIS